MPHTDEPKKKVEPENRAESNKISRGWYVLVAVIIAICIYVTYLIASLPE